MSLSIGGRYTVWYFGLVLLLAGLYVAGRVLGRGSPWIAGSLVVGALLAVGGLDQPVHLRPLLVDDEKEVLSGRRITPDLYRGLVWVRENTPVDAVLAVNSHYTEIGPFEYTYSGFGERRIFLEGWGYTVRARDSNYEAVATGRQVPFPGRLDLNRRAFAADPRALRQLSLRGIRYLVVDRVNGYGAAVGALRKRALVAYETPDVLILEVPAEQRPRGP